MKGFNKMSISKVFMICNAYESGVGHGLQDDKLCNPFPKDTDEHEAYDIGVEEGFDIGVEKVLRMRKESLE